MARKEVFDRMSAADRILQIGMAALGAILLLGALAVTVESALGPRRPAMVEVREIERDLVAGRTRVQIEAVNSGDITASEVTIEGRAMEADRAGVTLDYVPGRSRRTATLTFAGDIGTAPLALEAMGWVDP